MGNSDETVTLNFFEVYRQAHENAAALLKEANILLDNHCHARAYVLAFTSLEEISKSQAAADVYTGYSKEADFLRFYRDHKSKLERIMWAHGDANSYPHNLIWVGPDIDDVEKIAASEPLMEKRNGALYVGINGNQIKTPKEAITESDARGIIHVADTAFQRIWEVSGEFGGNEIGTKGFMK